MNMFATVCAAKGAQGVRFACCSLGRFACACTAGGSTLCEGTAALKQASACVQGGAEKRTSGGKLNDVALVLMFSKHGTVRFTS